METSTIDRLFLELAQVTRAHTHREIFLMSKLREIYANLQELEGRAIDIVELKIEIAVIKGSIGDPWLSGYGS